MHQTFLNLIKATDFLIKVSTMENYDDVPDVQKKKIRGFSVLPY